MSRRGSQGLNKRFGAFCFPVDMPRTNLLPLAAMCHVYEPTVTGTSTIQVLHFAGMHRVAAVERVLQFVAERQNQEAGHQDT